MAFFNVPNIPEITTLARLMGDTSSVFKSDDFGVQRIVNRGVGRFAGKSFGAVKASFGLFGMIATAQFFSMMNKLVKIQTAEVGGPVYVGSVAIHASWYENGVNNVPGRPALTTAILETPVELSRRRGFRFPKNLRSGIYDGQKLVSTFASFARGDIIQRAGRAEAGREITAFFFGTLRLGGDTRRPNFVEAYAKRVVTAARKNVKEMGQDTGLLRSSYAHGFGLEQMSELSRERGTAWLEKKKQLGRTKRDGTDVRSRMIDGTVKEGAGHIPTMPAGGGF